LIDWISVGKSSLWIGGLAAILASLSWASWMGARGRTQLRTSVTTPGVQTGLNVGLALVSAGLFFSARSVWEQILWLAFLLWFAAQALGAVRTGRATAVVRAPRPTLGRCSNADQSVGSLENAARWVASVEPWLLLALSPFLMFPNRFTPAVLPVLLLPWIARKFARGHFTARTAVDWPMVILLLMLPVSLWASPDLHRSVPKLYGIILGVAVFYGIVNFVRRPSQAYIAGLGIGLMGVAASVLSLVGTAWSGIGASARLQAYRDLSSVVVEMGGSLGRGFNPNQVGGALSFFIPFVASLLLLGFFAPWETGTALSLIADDAASTWYVRGWVVPILMSAGFVVMAGTLVLTGSRSAMVGVIVSLLVLAGFWQRWLRLVLVLALVGAALVCCYLGPQQILQWILAIGSDRNVVARLDLWERALYMIRDFPYTGVGLNGFSVTANVLYPLFSISPERVLEITHALNMFLQVALDLGIAGLVAYLAVLLVFVAAWCRVWQSGVRGPLRSLSVGLLCGMLGYHVYGLADCITLGAKPGVTVWAMWGLMAALANLTWQYQSGLPDSKEGAYAA